MILYIFINLILSLAGITFSKEVLPTFIDDQVEKSHFEKLVDGLESVNVLARQFYESDIKTDKFYRLIVNDWMKDGGITKLQRVRLIAAASALKGDFLALKQALDGLKDLDASYNLNYHIYHDTGSLLDLAVYRGDTNRAIVKYLIEDGCDVNFKNKFGETSILVAAGMGHLEVAKLLWHKGADINVPSKNGITPAMVAAYLGDLDMLQMLLKHGADVDVLVGDADFIQILVERGKALNEKGLKLWLILKEASYGLWSGLTREQRATWMRRNAFPFQLKYAFDDVES